MDYPEFIAVNASGTFVGGNFITELSKSFAGTGISSPAPGWFRNVDERDSNDNCSGSEIFGHGTHVAGLMSAKGEKAGIIGTCPTCALVVAKFQRCINVIIPTDGEFENTLGESITHLTDNGVSVINRSGGRDRRDVDGFKYSSQWCYESGELTTVCQAILAALENDVALVASAGNRLGGSLQWPAADPYTVSVGGLERDTTFGARLWQRISMTESFCPRREDPLQTNYPALVLPSLQDAPLHAGFYRECGTSARWGSAFLPPGTSEGFNPARIVNSFPNDRMTEFLAPARWIRSAIYTGANWDPKRRTAPLPPTDPEFPAPGFPYHNACSDDSDAPANCVGPACFDSYGNCTGTSMSAPIISGLIGLMRSTVPLARLGTTDRPENRVQSAWGGPPVRLPATHLRKAMVDNPVVAPGSIPVVIPIQLPQPTLSEVVGFGYPDASRVLDSLLGSSGGKPVRNRVSPMYTIYSPQRGDIGQTANPHQFMKWRWLFGFNSQPPMTTTVAPNAHWWFSEGGFEPPLRRAAFFVFTTDVVPKKTWETFEMLPVFHIGKPFSALPSVSVSPADYEQHLAVGVDDLNARLAGGYKLLGRQGFLVSPTQITQSCPDIGLTEVLRYCNLANDCVLLPLGHSVPSGYTATGSSSGCAVTTLDSDGDGLPDGFEAILGTNPQIIDSDCDGLSDGFEYPLNALPRSDPASGACP